MGLARGESVIKCSSPLNVLKDTHDHICCRVRSDGYTHLMIDSPRARRGGGAAQEGQAEEVEGDDD